MRGDCRGEHCPQPCLTTQLGLLDGWLEHHDEWQDLLYAYALTHFEAKLHAGDPEAHAAVAAGLSLTDLMDRYHRKITADAEAEGITVSDLMERYVRDGVPEPIGSGQLGLLDDLEGPEPTT